MRFASTRRIGWLLGVGAVLLGTTLISQAQEAFRASLAGQDAAEVKKRALANQKFDLKLGQLGFRFGPELDIEANDNIRFSDYDPQSDLVLKPQINVTTVWRATERNNLVLSSGLGYLYYVNGTEKSSFFVAPGSDLSFDIYAGAFLINLHDRFSLSQDVSGNPQITGIGSLNRLENTSGVGVTWDLNKVILRFGYDHSIYTALDDFFAYQDRTGELFNSSALFVLNPVSLLGLQVNGALINSLDETGRVSDNKQLGGGPVYLLQLSEYLDLRVSGGYTAYLLESIRGERTLSAFYGDATFRQRVNASLSHIVSVGHQLQTGLFTDTLELNYFNYYATWRGFRKLNFQPQFSYQNISQSIGRHENANRFVFGLTMSRQVTKHLRTSLNYTYYLRDSNVAGQNYRQNRLVLRFNYDF